MKFTVHECDWSGCGAREATEPRARRPEGWMEFEARLSQGESLRTILFCPAHREQFLAQLVSGREEEGEK